MYLRYRCTAKTALHVDQVTRMNEYWLLLIVIPFIVAFIYLVRRIKTKTTLSRITEPSLTPEPPQKEADFTRIFSQLSTLEERTKQLHVLEEKIEKIRDKQDSESKELRDKLYNEYSKRLQESIELLKETYAKMNATTSNAFREIADRSAESTTQVNASIAGAFREITDSSIEGYKQAGVTTVNAIKEISNRNAEMLQQTATLMNANTSAAFRSVTDRQLEVYKQTAAQLSNMTAKLEGAFKVLEEREHTQMRTEIEALRQKVTELEMDPLKVQLEELGEARTAQAVHEQSVRKITTIFWPNNGEIKFNEKIGQYVPDVLITNHRLKIVADEITTQDTSSLKEKVKKVETYMEGLNCNVGYVVIPNAGANPEELREIKRTAIHGLYIVRITEFAIHLQVWHDVTTNGLVDVGSLVAKGHSFLQVLEPIFEEFVAIVQGLEQREERERAYRLNRYKELKIYPGKIFDAMEKTQASK